VALQAQARPYAGLLGGPTVLALLWPFRGSCCFGRLRYLMVSPAREIDDAGEQQYDEKLERYGR